jgi:hypothetical protein
VWKRNFWVTFQDDPVGLALLEFCNEDQILWASDYPHPDSTFPDSQRIVAEQMAHITPLQRRKILRDNPIALYGLEDRAAATVARSGSGRPRSRIGEGERETWRSGTVC